MTRPAPRRIGRFDIRATLGAGGMGVVYAARDTHLGRDVAIKVLADGLASDPDALRRFEQEARAVSLLNHPNIITVFDAGCDDGAAYMVTELLQGTTLRERIAGRPLPPAVALDFAAQIAGALSAAHAAGIVHRDIKPHNIFVTRTGAVKVLDFGIARLLEREALTAGSQPTVSVVSTGAEVLRGTPAYMAPEQVRGGGADARSDIFAFGCVLFEMLTGTAPFERATTADTIAAILDQSPPRLPPEREIPRRVHRIAARCLEKDPADRFQSASDLRFAIDSARDGDEHSQRIAAPARPRARSYLMAAALVAAGAALATLAVWTGGTASPTDDAPVVVQATTVVPASARPIAPAISPDGKWITYIGLAGAAPQLYVQFLNAGAPVPVAGDADLPLQNRTIVGGIDVLPDGSGIAVAGRPRPTGLFQVPGIWIVPAPSGGPPQKKFDRYAAVRWSPDGRRIAGIIANPIVGDAVAVAAADGQDERILVPANGGMHLHQIAWGHDGRYVYYSRTLEANHSLGDICRVPSAGGQPEVVVETQGTAMFPAPTPDGRAVIYAGNQGGDGLNLWWRPLDGSAERRLTAGAGEFTEPFVSRDGRHAVALARRRRGGLVRVNAVEREKPVLETFGAAAVGDSDPATSVATERIFVTSLRSGRRQIWAVSGDGTAAVPITSSTDDDRRPAVAPDGRRVAFVSNRNGRRGIWLVSAEGGTRRQVVEAAVIDYVSWAPDGRRLVYATAGPEHTELWVADVDGGAPFAIPGARGRVPAWSPAGDAIAYVALDGDVPYVHLVSPDGTRRREPMAIDAVSLPTAIAWSPDATRIALVNLPGRAAAEAWILDVASGQLRRVAELAAPAEFDGVAWTADGRSLLLGRTEYESEVLLIQLK